MQAIFIKILGAVGVRLLEYLAENFIIPAAMYLYNRGMLEYDIKKGELKYKQLIKAKEENNEEDYNSIIDDI